MNKLNQRTNRLYSISDHAITLIALIVTIIIILILAGVTINLAVNSNLFDKAKKATGAYKNTSGDEQTWINEADKEIAKYMPGGTSEGGSGSGSESSKNPQEVNDDLVANHEKYYSEVVSEGQSSDKKDVGLDKDGKVVNLSKWYYVKTADGKGMSLGKASNSGCEKAYLGELVDGKIPDKVPEYIYFDSEDKVYPVVELNKLTEDESQSLTALPDIPDTIKAMKWTFVYNNNLVDFKIPTGVTAIATTFNDCKKLRSVTIPNSVTSIGYGTFSGCSSLESITIPNSVTSFGNSVFSSCSSLRNITIPDGVTSIGGYTFSGCSSLTSITIPNSVTSIEVGAFSGCSSLESITIPNSVTSIENRAFYDCSSLTSITIPDSVTSIGEYAFNNCRGLTSITIPDGVASIEGEAFYGCSSLASITIPKSVTSIKRFALEDCSNLKLIKYLGTKQEWNSIEKWTYGTSHWDDNTGNYVIRCTDGEITK